MTGSDEQGKTLNLYERNICENLKYLWGLEVDGLLLPMQT